MYIYLQVRRKKFTCFLAVNKNAKVIDIKKMLEGILKVPVDDQTLLRDTIPWTVMEDDKFLEWYDLTPPNATVAFPAEILLVLRNNNGEWERLEVTPYMVPESGSSEDESDSEEDEDGEPQPSTSQGKPQPSTSQGEPQPSTSQGEPQPSTSQEEPQPSTSQREPQLSTSQGEPQPSTSQGEPQPSTSQAEPQPSTSQAEPQPSTSRGKTKRRNRRKTSKISKDLNKLLERTTL